MHIKQPNGPAHIVMERNRYFTGKYMTARDFAGEQTYFLNRHRLHNRLLHGWGIVCGLRVKHHPDPDCDKEWVVVRSGIAIDCYGHEIVLPKDTAFKLTPRWRRPYPATVETDERQQAEREAVYESEATAVQSESAEAEISPERERLIPHPNRWTYLLGICYKEEEIEPVPVLYNEGDCDPAHQEANRWRETAELKLIPWSEVSPDCWKIAQGDVNSRCHDDCDEPLPARGGICLEPDCPCGKIVPLARLVFDPRNPEGGFKIDTNGRRQLPMAPELLTHITHINWPHGETITVADIRDWNRQFRVRFDRRLAEAVGDAVGVNKYTFVVQYGGVQRDIEFLKGRVKLEEDGHVAVFTIARNFEIEDLARNAIYITLKCDFILDCHENAVDGNHMKGLLPSGNGTPGGIFESWFFVVSNNTRDRED